VQTWSDVYRRVRETPRFIAWFGHGGRPPLANDFQFAAYCLRFEHVEHDGGFPLDNAPSLAVGALTQPFDRGAIILAITAAAYAVQTPGSLLSNGFGEAPSINPGRRDLFALYFQYTDDEKITPDQNVLNVTDSINNEARVMADALLGNGSKDIYPTELVVPPSSSISVKAASLMPFDNLAYDLEFPDLTVHVVFHVVEPRPQT